MKLIIDIPELAYDRLLGEQHIPNMDYEYLIIHGTPIPDNATNGDVIHLLFPNTSFSVFHRGLVNQIEIDMNWWNAPYQKGSKE